MIGAVTLPHILSNERLERLLCETDFHELLRACRELSSRVKTGDVQPGTYWVRMNRQPRLQSLPSIILEIDPTYVRIDQEGFVQLEMSGIPFYGLVAYPTATREQYSFKGDVELIPGLWYYDEDYNDDYPKHREKIDALMRKRKMYNQGRTRGGNGVGAG